MSDSNTVLFFVALCAGVLLIACGLFVVIALKFRRSYIEQFQLASHLQQKLKAEKKSPAIDTTQIEQYQQEIAQLQQALASAKENTATNSPLTDDGLADVEERSKTFQKMWEKSNQELIRAEAKIAELLAANKSMESDMQSLERRLAELSELGEDAPDSAAMREMIINFSEDSRELLLTIEKLTEEKQELQQQVEYIEKGGSGSTGKILGLQRRLDQAEEELKTLKAVR